jgi:hypothetical protein
MKIGSTKNRAGKTRCGQAFWNAENLALRQFGLAKLVGNLAFHDLAKGDVFRAEAFERLYKGLLAHLELLNAAGHNIDKDVGVLNDFLRF